MFLLYILAFSENWGHMDHIPCLVLQTAHNSAPALETSLYETTTENKRGKGYSKELETPWLQQIENLYIS